MRLFLDSSVLIAACASDRGASRELFRRARECGWILLASPYVVEEVLANLADFHPSATATWARLRQELALMDDVLSLHHITIFESAKDRPILFGALAWTETLLTLDRRDFGQLIGKEFYGLSILTPGMFLEQERAAGRLPMQRPPR